ncbi:GPW/gp25 family protein [Chitinophaga sp. MM2321]|uniref:GPW/gp25 family protein n=1 Tax=Chitinophaga sp. MM2321 TaxID=3137178 RepID=UPI0032D59E52
MTQENSFLGRGWSFPPSFDKSSAEILMLDGADDIESSLQILLSTALGERIMQPKYGCSLEDLLFDNLDTTLKTEMQNRIEKAILYFEPRIDVNKVDIVPGDDNAGLFILLVDYTIRNTNTRSNLVFPFYQTEGTNK